MSLIDQISEDIVKIPMKATNKVEAIRELVQVLKDNGTIEDENEIFEAIMQRESLGSTGLDRGIAVPHAKCPAVKSLSVVVGIAPYGIDFDSMDGDPTKIFFLLLASPQESGPHIEALAEIAEVTRSDAFCSALINAPDSLEVVGLFLEE